MKRLPTGGRIDRERAVTVSFDGRNLPAFAGDTLGSALLAGGEAVVSRSFKFHRPRGVFAAGIEDPNALLTLNAGPLSEPNARATVTEAYDGLQAMGQNAWPNVRRDIGAINGLFAPFLSAGFYYKTFVGPFRRSTKFWIMCETIIRKAAGMGRRTYHADPDH